MKTYNDGYLEALEDVAELLDNALANGVRIHVYEDLLDQLEILKEERYEQKTKD